MQSAAAGPTGTAIRKPMIAPSMASTIGLKAKPGTCIAVLEPFDREASWGRNQPILRGDELQLAFTHGPGRLEHGVDRGRGLAEGVGDISAFEPMCREQGGHRVSRAVGHDVESNQR